MKPKKKPGPKPKLKPKDRAKMRGITASDVEWKWVVTQAEKAGVTPAHFVRMMIQREVKAATD